MKPTRRSVLQGATALGGLAAIGCAGDKADPVDSGALEPTPERPPEPAPWVPDGSLDAATFPSGVQVGDVTTTAALISIWSSAPSLSLVLVQASGDTGWEEIQRVEDLVPDEYGVLQTELEGLSADTAYGVVALGPDGGRSDPTRFRTALDADGFRVITLAATSCIKLNQPWPSMSVVAAEQVDVALFLGDAIYADSQEPVFEYRTLWAAALGQEGMRALTGSTSLVATWDDHEVDNNWNWETPDIEAHFEEGLAAFRAGFPTRVGPGGTGIWRQLSWGAVMDLFVLDCRGERDGEQYLSTEQMDWFKAALSASSARFKVVLNSVPITDLTAFIGDAAASDRWQGHPAQRAEILEHIRDNGITGVLWLSGDLHYASAGPVDPPGGTADDQWEVLVGPGGSTLNVSAELFEGDPQWPVMFAAWNTTLIRLDPGTGKVLVRWVGDEGEDLDSIELSI